MLTLYIGAVIFVSRKVVSWKEHQRCIQSCGRATCNAAGLRSWKMAFYFEHCILFCTHTKNTDVHRDIKDMQHQQKQRNMLDSHNITLTCGINYGGWPSVKGWKEYKMLAGYLAVTVIFGSRPDRCDAAIVKRRWGTFSFLTLSGAGGWLKLSVCLSSAGNSGSETSLTHQLPATHSYTHTKHTAARNKIITFCKKDFYQHSPLNDTAIKLLMIINLKSIRW